MKKILLLVFILTFSLADESNKKIINKEFGLTNSEIIWWENHISLGGNSGDIDFELRDYLEDFKERGISVNQIKPWIEIGVTNKYKITEAVKNKVTSQEYVKWRQANGNQGIAIKDIVKLREVGITPNEYAKWRQANGNEYMTSENIIELKNIGVTPNEYGKYVKHFQATPDQIIYLAKLNMKPTKLTISVLNNSKIWTEKKVAPIWGEYLAHIDLSNVKRFKHIVNLLKINNCKVLESEYFNDADEYDNEGKCYRFTANLMQRISRYTGLAVSNLSEYYNNTNSNIYFVTFKDSWREGTNNWGIIKGEGSFRYTTMGGASKVVAKGKVIY